jgi:NAD(P)-dependent dehydrogenase (short-subunit alcohol dehydrogenase family)
VTTILLDISSDESIEKARLDVQSRFGKLDVLVVRTAISYSHQAFPELYLRTTPPLPTTPANSRRCPFARSSLSHTTQMSSALPA